MNYPQIKNLVKNSAAFRLFKKEYAAFIISFLYTEFKVYDQLTIAADAFARALKDTIDSYKEESLLENEFLLSPEHYTNEWANEGFIRKFYEETKGEFYIEITPEMESVFKWISEVERIELGEVIETRSRFINIFQLLKELVDDSTITTQDRIRILEAQKKNLEQEIERLKKGGEIKKLDKREFQEQFKLALKEAKDLVADFRQIERNFSEITKQTQANYLNQISSKGAILDFVLKADEDLMNSPQGKSFKAFWQFIISPQRQDEFEKIVSTLYKRDDVKKLDESQFLKKLKKLLLESGRKVNRATDKMADQIRKALSDKSLQESRRIKEIINEIKSLSLKKRNLFGSKSDFYSIESFPEIYLPIERPLWEKKDKTLKADYTHENAVNEINSDIMELLMRHNAINLDELISNIDSLLKYKPKVELKEVIEKYPLKKGLEELVTYLWIASNREQHFVDSTKTEEYSIHIDDEKTVSIKFPQVVYKI
ncbi:MAG TPA: DUF3375 family protein [Leptospiraceae bacterium]|nr:DUF3375 family protein [Leptospiraceae bacterium]HMX32501.1 DUF3375 family protein [Leptospiraceae bacterium]HMY30235.1 DUF3375 family protein [Leptospiraceae bacterium]HNA07186.1 DUF3375 family protein [Leptospiraceae bacterium]HNC01119.1 DUF3375 family protein [Leptospiraceae bacterium]